MDRKLNLLYNFGKIHYDRFALRKTWINVIELVAYGIQNRSKRPLGIWTSKYNCSFLINVYFLCLFLTFFQVLKKQESWAAACVSAKVIILAIYSLYIVSEWPFLSNLHILLQLTHKTNRRSNLCLAISITKSTPKFTFVTIHSRKGLIYQD